MVFWSPSKCWVKEAVSHVGYAWSLIRRGTLFFATHAREHAINFLPKFGSLHFWESFHDVDVFPPLAMYIYPTMYTQAWIGLRYQTQHLLEPQSIIVMRPRPLT